MLQPQTTCFFRFMRLFRVSMFSLIDENETTIRAIVAWPETCSDGFPDPEEVQMVSWTKDDTPILSRALDIGEYAARNGLIESDKLDVNIELTADRFGFSVDETIAAVNKLLAIRVAMIDDGEETDSFFLHE